MDERNKQIAGQVIAMMYFITIIAMQGIMLYRQFILKQDISEFEDLAVLVTINSIFLISALLYFGAVQIRKLAVKTIVLLYLVLVVLGTLFTYIKYNILGPGLSFAQLFDKLFIIMAIIGLMLGFWILLAILGKRKIEKELE